MGNLFKLPITINKKTGQLSTYVNQKELPEDVLEAIRQQPSATRRLLFQFKGVEND